MSITIPNLISLARLGLVPLFIIAVLDDRAVHALAIIAVAGLSDLLDGLIARFWGQQSVLGAYLDPIADKLLLVSAYATLAISGVQGGPAVPLWVAVLVIARDVIILVVSLVLYLALGVSEFPPSLISKITTAVQIGAVVLVIAAGIYPALAPVARMSLYLVALFTVASGLHYISLASRMSGERKG